MHIVKQLPEFDMAEHLGSDQAIAEYLTVVMEENDPAEFAHALGTIARARGMTEVVRASGLTREALYKALRPTSQPRFDRAVPGAVAVDQLVAQRAQAHEHFIQHPLCVLLRQRTLARIVERLRQ